MPNVNGGETGEFKKPYLAMGADADTYYAGDVVILNTGTGRVQRSIATGAGGYFVPRMQVVENNGDMLAVMINATTVWAKFKATCEVATPVEPSDGVGNEGKVMAFAATNPENICGRTAENVTNTTDFFKVVIT